MSTRVTVMSKDSNDIGLPGRLGIYEIGEAQRVGNFFNVPVVVLREDNLSLPRPRVLVRADSADAARAMAIGHYRQIAAQLDLDIIVVL